MAKFGQGGGLGGDPQEIEQPTQGAYSGVVDVVAPYNALVSAMHSGTASLPQDAPCGMTFLHDGHCFNVASSQARSAVIVVASNVLFEPDCRTTEQMRWTARLCRYRGVRRLSDRIACPMKATAPIHSGGYLASACHSILPRTSCLCEG